MGFILDTADIPAGDRVEAVHAAMMNASAPCQVIHEHPERGIRTRIEVWELGRANVFTARSSGIRLLRTARQARQDAAPVIALSVQRRGDGRHQQLERRQTVAPGELIAVDLSSAYDYSWSGEGAAACVQIPIEELGLPVDVIRRALGRLPTSPLYPMVTGHIAHLARDAERISADPAAPGVGAAGIELARALLASATHDPRYSRPVLAETLPTRIRAYVRRHLNDPGLSPETIAAAHHISLRYLYKVCADAGLGLEQWIIGERLKGAREELASTDARGRTIAMIARRWGFRDPTHFTRRFRAAYGVTPGEWRRLTP
ncbi:helix-turn-helix domain-containing protein [Spongiactinospora sp. TRM90649]|uniref:helix-turn-helix domain-containing protein n=1 Tax=Spongiactinospora sp. TRM90649 TaxID=3031114 RepID=UPI0023F9C364|nr:helix-turn-helix domain-containing protein [Spongiactinospora sp. TRM90649]MDF5754366.1 helix-turn-helix domain-containing protein [Spongiactinospora sp. TRM90649]